jgi:endonuclease/exonuclease/phosphatase family metal-dependent hydrolase
MNLVKTHILPQKSRPMTARTFLFFLILILAGLSAKAQDSLTIVSHNVLAFAGHPTEIHRTDSALILKAAAFYKSQGADLVVLQECPEKEGIELLARAMGFHLVFLKQGWKGNPTSAYPYGFPGAILSRYPLTLRYDVHASTDTIPKGVYERHFGGAEIKTKKGTLLILGNHLCADYDGKFREETRLEELNFAFRKMPDCKNCIATVWAGDFNSKPGSLPYQRLVNAGFIDTQREENYPTVPVPDPKVRIDYIFLKSKKALRFKALPIALPVDKETGLHFSDHVPCMSRIYLRVKS